jgi:hypothetical protein
MLQNIRVWCWLSLLLSLLLLTHPDHLQTVSWCCTSRSIALLRSIS